MKYIYKDFKKLLSPEIIARLNSIDLKAKFVVEGFLIGLHKSPYHGFSVEFSEYRPYMIGDDAAKIDWKLYAKTDKYYIKKYEEETNLRSIIILDKSRSMSYTSGGISKYEYSALLAASLSYLMVNQKDAIGLALFSDKIEKFISPKATKQNLLEIFKALSDTIPSDKTDTVSSLKLVAEQIKKRSLIIVISDFFDEVDKILSSIKQFRVKNNEVIVFQVVDDKEFSFDFTKDAIFKDLETNEEILTLPHQIRKSYSNAFSEFQKKLEMEFKKNKIDYNLIKTSESFDKALLSFLIKRKKLH